MWKIKTHPNLFLLTLLLSALCSSISLKGYTIFPKWITLQVFLCVGHARKWKSRSGCPERMNYLYEILDRGMETRKTTREVTNEECSFFFFLLLFPPSSGRNLGMVTDPCFVFFFSFHFIPLAAPHKPADLVDRITGATKSSSLS